MLVSIEVKVLVLLSVEIEVLVLVSVEIEVLVVVSVEIEVLSNGSLWFGFGSLGWLWKIVVRSHKSINNKRSTTALEPGTASSMVVSPELLAPPPNRVLQAAGYQRMLAPNHPQLRNRVLQAVGISHWFVHIGEDRSHIWFVHMASESHETTTCSCAEASQTRIRRTVTKQWAGNACLLIKQWPRA